MSWDVIFYDRTKETINAFYQTIPSILLNYYNSVQSQFALICHTNKETCAFPISVLDFTMLRTNIWKKRYVAEVIVYGKDHFFDPFSMTLGEIDLSPIFEGYEIMYQQITKEAKKYIGKVSKYDVSGYMIAKAAEFYKIFIYFMRRHITELIALPEFSLLPFAKEFEINCGEYAAYTETIYKSRADKVEAEELKNLHTLSACNFMEFRGMDFAGEILENLDLRYSDFSFCNFEKTSFCFSNLDFSRFMKVNASHADFSDTILNGSNFTESLLNNARFLGIDNQSYYSEEECGLPFKKEYEINFRKTDLRGAEFKYSDLSNVDFTEALMLGVKMDELSFKTAPLCEKQRQEIVKI